MEIIDASYENIAPQDVPARIAFHIGDGKKICGVIQCGKSGFIFLFTTP